MEVWRLVIQRLCLWKLCYHQRLRGLAIRGLAEGLAGGLAGGGLAFYKTCLIAVLVLSDQPVGGSTHTLCHTGCPLLCGLSNPFSCDRSYIKL